MSLLRNSLWNRALRWSNQQRRGRKGSDTSQSNGQGVWGTVFAPTRAKDGVVAFWSLPCIFARSCCVLFAMASRDLMRPGPSIATQKHSSLKPGRIASCAFPSFPPQPSCSVHISELQLWREAMDRQWGCGRVKGKG